MRHYSEFWPYLRFFTVATSMVFPPRIRDIFEDLMVLIKRFRDHDIQSKA